MPISETGTPSQYFLPLKISRPKKAPFCDFSVFVLFYVLFRNCVPVGGGSLFCYIEELARAYRDCSDFVFILFIFGNMIQKTEFVYNCRKKVKKSIAIKKK